MCEPGQQASPAAAMAAVTAGLTALAGADMTGLTPAEHADLLRALGRAETQAVAVRSSVLAAFDSACGHELDGAGTARSWLRWQTRVTPAAAAGASGWMRRLRAHPVVAAELAAGAVSPSWARQVSDWTDRLDQADRDAADRVLLAAAAGGAELADLAGLAEEIRARTARTDTDGPDDGFDGRTLRLAEYWEGNGHLTGDLTAECAAALRAVLDALNARTGPEDLRSPDQRDHDALYEALTRLLAARCLPERGGQPAQIQLHMSLDQLLGLPGAARAVADWAGHGAIAPPGADCDATVVPVVTGHSRPRTARTAGRGATEARPRRDRHCRGGRDRGPRADPGPRDQAAVRSARAGGLAAAERDHRDDRDRQPGPRHRHPYRGHPPAPPSRGGGPRQALQLSWLFPAGGRLPGAPHPPSQQGRTDEPHQPPAAVTVNMHHDQVHAVGHGRSAVARPLFGQCPAARESAPKALPAGNGPRRGR